MQLSLDSQAGSFAIQSYTKGSIKVKDKVYTLPLIIAPDRLIEDWHPQGIQTLTLADLQPLLELKPEVIILGSGEAVCFPSPEHIATFHQHRIGVEVMPTAAACRTFNVLLAEGRKVIAALL